MPATTDRTPAAAYAERLFANGNAKNTGRIDYAAWNDEQRAIWRAVEARGERFTARVHRALRGEAR